jgi:predicted RNA-binding protein with PIN domain
MNGRVRDAVRGEATAAELPSVPELLLVPLLDTAAEVLRAMEPADVPVTLRPLIGFDRRGLARNAARHQLLRALETDEAFRDATTRRFAERPEVIAAVERWSVDAALGQVDDAAERADLPLLASVLYAARPEGWAFGLGVVVAVNDRHRQDKEEGDDAKARELQVVALDEARRRAEAAREQAAADLERLEGEIREDRQSRRGREAQSERAVADASRRADAAEAAQAKANQAADAAQLRMQREAERATRAEKELRRLRQELATREAALAEAVAKLERAAAPGAGLRYADVQALTDAATLARRLADGLEGVAVHARQDLGVASNDEQPTPKTAPAAPDPRASAATTPVAPGRRVQPHLPGGMFADTAQGFDSMVRTPGVGLIVDGYNASMLAWPDASVAEQRERLGAALGELHLRTRCPITVVFDGADVSGVAPARRPGVRTIFSPAADEADTIVIRELAVLPKTVPIIVASSDAWVREHAQHEGAVVVSARTLLESLGR